MSRARFAELRAAHERDRDAAMPGLLAQLEWPDERLRAEREHRMRHLLATAKARSPWHRERLRHVDAEAFTEADLPSLPTMTKDDLFNPTLPLIRYVVTDQMALVAGACACGATSRRIDHVHGRSGDVFTYPGDVRVHPLTIRAPLGRHRHVVEYQVLQTERGVCVRLCANGPIDHAELAASIAGGLRGCGISDPDVVVEEVPSLSRQVSGKLKRFVPL